MGYQHIDNLYRDQRILLLRECYALEKIHGTSAHISWTDGRDNITGAETGTPTRLEHVLDKIDNPNGGEVGLDRMRDVIDAMVEDVLRESAGEIVDSKEARTAIGRKTAEIFKAKRSPKTKVVEEGEER